MKVFNDPIEALVIHNLGISLCFGRMQVDKKQHVVCRLRFNVTLLTFSDEIFAFFAKFYKCVPPAHFVVFVGFGETKNALLTNFSSKRFAFFHASSREIYFFSFFHKTASLICKSSLSRFFLLAECDREFFSLQKLIICFACTCHVIC